MAETAVLRTEPLIVGIQFRTATKIYHFTTTDDGLKIGDRVIVAGEDGPALATVIAPPSPPKGASPGIKPISHRATDAEINEENSRREQAHHYFKACSRKIKELALPMKLTDAELLDRGKKIRFVFYAEDRVDFRSLVKELAAILRLRIEMRQVGARDEAKYRGCLGACGQVTTCCSTFLRQFRSISIGMAKTQGLAPNPSKLTGLCGKLKCCLAYENDLYSEQRKGLFKIGNIVAAPQGTGKIINIDILTRRYLVAIDGGSLERIPADTCRRLEGEERSKRDAELVAKEEQIGRRREQEQQKREERRRGGARKGRPRR